MTRKYTLQDRNILDYINRKIEEAIGRVRNLENSKTVTLPIYDVNDLPPLIDGQAYIGSDNKLYIYVGGTSRLV